METQQSPPRKPKKSTPPTTETPKRERRGPVTLVSNCTRRVHVTVRRFDEHKQPVLNEDGTQATYALVIGSTLDASDPNPDVPKPTLEVSRNAWIALKRDSRAYRALIGRRDHRDLQIIND